MAHIPDGLLSAPVLFTGAAFTAAAVTYAVRRLEYDHIPKTALLAATFFIVSLISIPVGAGSIHLLLNGLMGLILGWSAIPAILIALVLQAAFFGYGGLIVLGVNTANLALPAILCGLIFSGMIRRSSGKQVFWVGAMAGAFTVVSTGLLVSLSIGLSGKEFVPAAKIIMVAYLPLIIAEAAVTGATISFLKKVSPERWFSHETAHA